MKKKIRKKPNHPLQKKNHTQKTLQERLTLLLGIWLHDKKYQSNGVYHSNIMLPLRQQRLQQAFTNNDAYRRSKQLSFIKKTALSPGSVGHQSLQSSFWYQSKDTGISGSS